jgi:hypothetical protein
MLRLLQLVTQARRIMQTDPYSWNIADWSAFFEADGYSPDEASNLAVEALQWHKEAMATGREGPDDTDPHYFWIGFSC